MSELLPPVIVRIIGDAKSLTGALGGASAELEGFGSKAAAMAGIGRAALFGLAGAAATVGGASLKLAGDFESTMERLHTQAQVPQESIAGLSKKVLDLSGDVATAPNSLAQSLYHVESAFQSTGISGEKAMEIVRVAAQGAKIGGADLVDVTNALDSAIVAGIPGAENFEKAMGALNATVGAGDMKMQDLADALSTGVLPVVKNYGLTLLDAGAALATFGDNNIRGEQAGTQLRMAVQALAVPTKQGTKLLEEMGIQSGQLAKDMQQGGLLAAFDDLKGRMTAAGYTGVQTGEKLTEIFGKRAGVGVAVLFDQLDRLKSKYADIEHAAGNFGDAWEQTQKTFKFQLDQLVVDAEKLGVRIGNFLIPKVRELAGALADGAKWLSQHRDLAISLAAAIGGPLVLAMGIFIATTLVAAAPFIALGAAIGGLTLGIITLYRHSEQFRSILAPLAATAQSAFDALPAVVERAVAKASGGFRAFAAAFRAGGNDITSSGFAGFLERVGLAARKLWDESQPVLAQLAATFRSAFVAIQAVVTQAVVIISDLWRRFGERLVGHIQAALSGILQILRGALEILQGIFDIIAGVLTGDWSRLWRGITEIFGGAWNLIIGVLRSAVNIVSTIIGGAMALISAIWGASWHAIATFFTTIWDQITGLIGAGLGWLTGAVSGAVGTVRGIWSSAWGAVRDVVAGAWGAIRGAVGGGISEMIGLVGSIPGRILGAIGDLGGLLVNAGRRLVRGLIDGIQSAFQAVKDTLSSLTNLLPSWKGPADRDATLLHESGRLVIGGFVDGLRASIPAVRATLRDVTAMVGSYNATASVSGIATSSTGTGLSAFGRGFGGATSSRPEVLRPAGGGSTVTINAAINVVAPTGTVPESTIRAIRDGLLELGRRLPGQVLVG